ncbi:MAG: glycerol-3-phosphate 1-O-acyltransferase PlsY [Verrucomicrobiales bacterium]|nr:glycerol-3-phosphate 1-O-acyltransferase PlsY [Verrucomicrobiales bacterium]
MPDFSDPLNWLCILLGYLIGATPFGLIAGKMKGIDIRQHGSGNIGATNVLRTLGKPVGITVLILDILKGMIPVIISMWLSDNTIVHIATAIATILGHNFTFWLKFKGGKGIATTAGAMILLIPIPAVVSILSWIIFFKVTRYVSIGSIAAALALPIVGTIQAIVTGDWNRPILIFCTVLCVMAIWKHRGNIQRLMKGEEPRFQKKSEKKEKLS